MTNLERLAHFINKASDVHDSDERAAQDYIICALYAALAELEERRGDGPERVYEVGSDIAAEVRRIIHEGPRPGEAVRSFNARIRADLGDLDSCTYERMWAKTDAQREELATALHATTLNANRMYERLMAIRRYVDDPGNWSALDGRRAHLLALLDGTEES